MTVSLLLLGLTGDGVDGVEGEACHIVQEKVERQASDTDQPRARGTHRHRQQHGTERTTDGR